MHVIWKYQINLNDLARHDIEVPIGATPVLVADQHGHSGYISIWYRCDPTAPKSKRRIQIVGTGWVEINPLAVHLGSVVCGDYVWHLFDTTELA